MHLHDVSAKRGATGRKKKKRKKGRRAREKRDGDHTKRYSDSDSKVELVQ